MSNWVTPVTDRNSGAWHTLTDQNRIAGNLDYLATGATAHQLYTGPSITKTAYVYNDYVTVDNWANILEVLSALLEAFNLEGSADSTMAYTNINNVESLTLAVYNKYQLMLSQSNANHYAGDDIYTENNLSPYVGGIAV